MEQQARRRRRRVRMARTIRVRPSSPGDKHFEEVRTTVSTSPEGLYFTTRSDNYYRGMRLFVTCPYSKSGGQTDEEYLGEVVSIDSLGPYRHGVAVRYLSTINRVP